MVSHLSPVQPSLFLSKHNHSVSINESFYDKKVDATKTDPDLALRHTWSGDASFQNGVLGRKEKIVIHGLVNS